MQSAAIDWRQVALGSLALGLGIVLYLVDRPASETYFVPESLSLFSHGSTVFGSLGQHMPTFLHVFAFCLLSSGILDCNKRCALLVCGFWLCLDGLFEIAQHDAIAERLVPWVPDWFNGIPILENTANYFSRGHFDPLDLASIVLGSMLAYLTISLLPTHPSRQQA